MQGWHVPRRAGWDCHGLPVEIAAEQELGFAGKPDIEKYGIAEFNARCRESVERHVADFAELTNRMGYWVDMSTACSTRTTGSPPTAPGAAPACPTTSSPRATRRSPTRRCSSGCPSPAASGPA